MFDIIIIGGGATGLGTAVEASHKGLAVVLFEKYDFAKGTSSKATKLLHGGVRYLAQGNIRLVFDALRERGRAIRNAPHLTGTVDFVIPVYTWFQKYYYLIGLKIYDILAGGMSLGKTISCDKETVLRFLPDLKGGRLKGGIIYKDGYFDDARMCITLAQTANEKQACILNYFEVLEINRISQDLSNVVVYDSINKAKYDLKSKVVINATGIFAEEMVKDIPSTKNKIRIAPAQGIHLVIDKEKFNGVHGLMIPRTSDGRVLFSVPWKGKVILGTTDTPLNQLSIEPSPKEKEIKFILHTFNKYITQKLTKQDINTVFTGIRPLVRHTNLKNTAKIPRDHTIVNHQNGIITITGGKWTTYRHMAEQVIAKASKSYGLSINSESTKELKLYASTDIKINIERLEVYGTKANEIIKLEKENLDYCTLIHSKYPYTKAQLKYGIDNEMVMKPEDFLARRIRLVFQDAKACVECIDNIVLWMAEMMEKDESWMKNAKEEFETYIKHYLLF